MKIITLFKNRFKKGLIILSLIAIPVNIFACSTFALVTGKEILVGNNDDWFCNIAYFSVNPRGITKQVFLPSADKKLEWTSKYGSVTINFNFIGSPSGGMNEAGLVIDESWPGPCRYPAPDDRPAIDEIQWLQYQFDNCATVDEVIQTDSKIRIVGFFGKSHYYVCDKNGKSATIEWIDGKMVSHVFTRDSLPVLTNDNYNYSIAEIKRYKGFGGDIPIGNSTSSFDRFCRAAEMVKYFKPDNNIPAIDYSFGILDNISQQSTIFSWVYDITNLTICYRTSLSKEIKMLPLSRFDFSAKTPKLMANILTTKSGDISDYFESYTLEKNRDFVKKVVENWRANGFATHITEADIEKMIGYPETEKRISKINHK